MAGIYIHIPFCKQACHYCNFHFATSLRYKNEMIEALLKEISLRKEYLQHEVVETIYLGGGTPSLLENGDLNSLVNKIKEDFDLLAGYEFTIETNPDDITDEKLMEWEQAGINRLSIGIQSFFDEDLQWMNRAHNANQAYQCLESATKYFNNITIDLIYGTPLTTHEKWKQNVEAAVSFNIPHLSCYALTVEPKTPLEKMICQHQSAAVDQEKQSEQFLLLMEWLNNAGYEHYEISNFAKTGWRSRHNSSYWQGKKYLGIGPSAHSYDGMTRQWNISNNSKYIHSVQQNTIPSEMETLTPVQKLNEYIMTSLRTIEGLHLEKLNDTEQKKILERSAKYIQSKMICMENNCLKLTNEGKLMADGIAADLFF